MSSPGLDRSIPQPVEAIVEDLRARVVELSEGQLSRDAVDSSGHLFDYGYVDSLSAVMFLAQIEESCGVRHRGPRSDREVHDARRNRAPRRRSRALALGDTSWNDFELLVQMPHMAPGEKLSEVEFLKVLAAYQWEAIARALRPPPARAGERAERASLRLGDRRRAPPRRRATAWRCSARTSNVHVRNRVRFFAKKFVEGLFVIDDQADPDVAARRRSRRARICASCKSRGRA